MRCDQFIGLNERAEVLIKTKDTRCDKCGRGGPEKIRLKGRFRCFGMYDSEGSQLPGYFLKNGTTVYEDVQVSQWSSGPVIFTALRGLLGDWIKETLWTDEEIEQYL